MLVLSAGYSNVWLNFSTLPWIPIRYIAFCWKSLHYTIQISIMLLVYKRTLFLLSKYRKKFTGCSTVSCKDFNFNIKIGVYCAQLAIAKLATSLSIWKMMWHSPHRKRWPHDGHYGYYHSRKTSNKPSQSQRHKIIRATQRFSKVNMEFQTTFKK